MKRVIKLVIASLAGVVILTGCMSNTSSNTTAKTLRVYTSRHYDIDNAINQKFTEQTGIKIELVELKGTELIERLTREKNQATADLILFNGAERLTELKKQNLLQAHDQKDLNTLMEDGFYGDDWIAMTKRPRGFVTLKESTNPLSTYAELAQDTYAGNVFVRSSTSEYNVGLVSALYQQDPNQAEAFVSGVVKNFAQKPSGNDRDQAKNVVAKNDVNAVAIMNSYYLERMRQGESAEEKAAYEKVKVVYPEAAFTNISVMGISASSKQKDETKQFMQYLLSKDVQTEYMLKQTEYPVRKDVELAGTLATFPKLTSMKTNYETFGEYADEAATLFTKYGWE